MASRSGNDPFGSDGEWGVGELEWCDACVGEEVRGEIVVELP